jgi:hypothetical protein
MIFTLSVLLVVVVSHVSSMKSSYLGRSKSSSAVSSSLTATDEVKEATAPDEAIVDFLKKCDLYTAALKNLEEGIEGAAPGHAFEYYKINAPEVEAVLEQAELALDNIPKKAFKPNSDLSQWREYIENPRINMRGHRALDLDRKYNE